MFTPRNWAFALIACSASLWGCLLVRGLPPHALATVAMIVVPVVLGAGGVGLWRDRAWGRWVGMAGFALVLAWLVAVPPRSGWGLRALAMAVLAWIMSELWRLEVPSSLRLGKGRPPTPGGARAARAAAIYPRPVPREWREYVASVVPLGHEGPRVEPGPGELGVCLVEGGPASDRYLTAADLRERALDWEQALALAGENLLAEVTDRSTSISVGDRQVAIVVESRHAAGGLFVPRLRTWLQDQLGTPCVIVVPAQDELVAIRHDALHGEVGRSLLSTAREHHARDRHAVSLRLHRLEGDRILEV